MSVTVLPGDMLERLAEMEPASLDACVTDPPYGLAFMGKGWDHAVPGVDYWRAVYRVLKPGAHVTAFGGSRSWHRMAAAIEDAGFEIRDCLMFLYGAGFPKSLNVSKKLEDFLPSDAQLSCETCGCQTVRDSRCGCPSCRGSDGGRPHPASDAAQCAPPSQADALERNRVDHSEGGRGEARASIFPDGETDRHASDGSVPRVGRRSEDCLWSGNTQSDNQENTSLGARISERRTALRKSDKSRSDAGLVSSCLPPCRYANLPQCAKCLKRFVPSGLGTALKPSVEFIVLARKPLESTVAGNVLKHGTGALNVDACRVGFAGDADRAAAAAAVGFDGTRARGTGRQSQSIGKESRDGTNPYDPQSVAGRWPPNTLHDGSPEVLAAFARFGESVSSDRERMNRADEQANVAFTKVPGGLRISNGHADSGSAARFFPSLGFGDDDLRFWYGGKAGADDRLASKHPTVKPVALMRWLVRLITPPGGTILDPFAGTGTTGAAAIREGFDAVLIEREPEYVADIHRRLAHIRGDDTPLFASTSPDLFAGAAE